jgi:UDP-N-acetylmuramoylalanine--D-glutamate ligase
MDLLDKRVLVMGLGLHGGGLGVVRWLLRRGALVTITDLRKPEELAPSLEALRDDASTGSLQGGRIEYVLGEHREDDFAHADLVVRNPGVPRESRFLAIARERGIPIRMEMGLFLEQLPRGADQVIGVTGTKGKTTTTMMLGAMLKMANPKTVVAGNLRVSALELLDQIDGETPIILELSSFQLEEFETLKTSPRIAAITNIFPDHLDRYPSMTEYVAAKANIFQHQGITDYCILNFDNSALTHLRPHVPSHVVWFSRLKSLNDGAYVDRGDIVWREHGKKSKIAGVAEMKVHGSHNVENALAATAAASVWGATPENISESLRYFKGVPHRLEVVRELNGVRYINDTTATAPAATIAALRALEGAGRRIILIAGGSDKGLDYGEMAHVVSVMRAVVILVEGSATPKIERALRVTGCGDQIVGIHEQFQDAVMQAHDLAHTGDIVLLSPGAASFGMFANEFRRGDKFNEIVARLA